MVIILFPNLANGWKWSMFLQYLKFSVILNWNLYIYYIFSYRYVVDYISRHLIYTHFQFFTTPHHQHDDSGEEGKGGQGRRLS